ncbi:MAG TPA: hypothetical protein VKB76_11040 [Ktedonobacterales bacterium]|nr:hypothetical protein [Ktedonobacterales bacterium]
MRNVTYAGVAIYALPWAQASSSMRRASPMCAASSMSDDQEKSLQCRVTAHVIYGIYAPQREEICLLSMTSS